MARGSIRIGNKFMSKSEAKKHAISILKDAKAESSKMKSVVLYTDEVNNIIKILKSV